VAIRVSHGAQIIALVIGVNRFAQNRVDFFGQAAQFVVFPQTRAAFGVSLAFHLPGAVIAHAADIAQSWAQHLLGFNHAIHLIVFVAFCVGWVFAPRHQTFQRIRHVAINGFDLIFVAVNHLFHASTQRICVF